MPESRRDWLGRLKSWLHRLMGGKAQPPGDPFADRLVPVRRGPKGRSGAAVAEPEDGEDYSFPPRRG
jgi:hypothetical protein